METINEHRVTVAVWRRRLPAVLDAWIGAQQSRGFLELGIIARPKLLPDELRQAADAVGMLPSLGRRAFLEDVADLARDAAAIADAPSVDVRLSVAPVAALNAELLVQEGVSLLAVYHAGSAAHRQCTHRKRAEAEGWQLAFRGTSIHLERTSVLMLKGREKGDHATLQWLARGSGKPAHGFIYLLEIRP